MAEKVKFADRLTIKDLLSKSEYLIPLYQRNYAWGRDEIFQLLNDINKSTGNYYLGTLVVSKREISQEKFQYEIIDGQQRHTTLSIINATFKNRNNLDVVSKRNLYFEVRDKCEQIIDDILNQKINFKNISTISINDVGVSSIINACNIVEEFLFEKLENNVNEIQNFAKRFYDEVIIFRAELPVGTDLNHYFEIMNNRGEQLEKHEILKASFMNSISDTSERSCFSAIWEACSNMNSHVQMNFSNSNDRGILFGEDYQGLNILNFIDKRKELDKAEKGDTKNDDIDKSNSLDEILSNHILPPKFVQKANQNLIDRFNSIIDFPNFLLQVLRLEDEYVRLDDKFLLDDFGSKSKPLPNAMEFIEKLLRFRVMFDRYIVKREGGETEWTWSLMKAVNNDNVYNVTFEEADERRKLKMIQTMFHVTFSANNYKNWFFEIMKFFKKSDSISIQSFSLLKALDVYAKEYYITSKTDRIFSAGLNTPRFIFNYLDYLLWITYYNEIRGKSNIEIVENYINNSIEKNKVKFGNFKFVQRTSIEHLYPQSRLEELIGDSNEKKKEVLDSFGNLCLISSSSNSSYNGDLPTQKRHDSKGKNESLKQLIMFANFDEENWNTNEINKHQEEMEKLIEHQLN